MGIRITECGAGKIGTNSERAKRVQFGVATFDKCAPKRVFGVERKNSRIRLTKGVHG